MAATYAGAGWGRMNPEREELHRQACQRSLMERWNAKGRSCVVHPERGAVVVPHSSNLTALLNAAEYWGCDWLEIRDAEVRIAKPEDGPAVKPKEFVRKRGTA